MPTRVRGPGSGPLSGPGSASGPSSGRAPACAPARAPARALARALARAMPPGPAAGTDALDDAALTRHGLAAPISPEAPGTAPGTAPGAGPDPAPAGGRVLVLACGALAREILAVIAANGLHHLDLHCLPAILHNTPDAIPDAVEAAVRAHADRYAAIFVAYADCGTGGLLQARCAALGVEMIAGPHCYSFFEGNAAFAARDEFTAFYLTDFLVRQFDAFVTRPLGLDRFPELRDTYFGNYDRLVYQAQVDDPALTEMARAHAATLGLRFERRFTGYGDLEPALRGLAPPGGGGGGGGGG